MVDTAELKVKNDKMSQSPKKCKNGEPKTVDDMLLSQVAFSDVDLSDITASLIENIGYAQYVTIDH